MKDPVEMLSRCLEDNDRLREEIQKAGGHLQPDGSYKWAFWIGDPPVFVLMPVDEWIAKRKETAVELQRLFELVDYHKIQR